MRAFESLLGNRVLLEQKKLRKVGMIILADESVEKAQEAEVLMVGPDCEAVKKGDIVLFDKFAGEVLKDNDDSTITLVTEDDIFGILEK